MNRLNASQNPLHACIHTYICIIYVPITNSDIDMKYDSPYMKRFREKK